MLATAITFFFVVVIVVQELSIDFSKFVYLERKQNEIILMN